MDLVSIPENPAPAGAVPARLRAIDGVPLRAVRWHPQGEARGTVLIAPGRAEYVEKYFETVGDLLTRGLVVVVFDWRGQGMSGRELDDRRKGHIDDFSLYLRDLDLRAIPTETNWGKYFHDLLGVINLQAVHCDDWNFLVFRKLKLSF